MGGGEVIVERLLSTLEVWTALLVIVVSFVGAMFWMSGLLGGIAEGPGEPTESCDMSL